ncbi:hypothetical protein [Mycolicibacterium sp.]|uniref:hypothetical protein n=1 Tax=Mycolicibacterium sp. TaxID=2320850 RepID=UPI003560E3DD
MTAPTSPLLLPVPFDAPLANPAPNGLFAATTWVEEDGPLRWLDGGVDVRVFNYGGEEAFGVWTAPWCASADDLDDTDVKDGERPDFPDSFAAMTVWATDECDLTKQSQDEVRTRAAQVLRLQEQTAAEDVFAQRLLADAPAAVAVADVVAAVSALEAALAKTNTVGVIHAGAQWAAVAAQANLIVRSGTGLKTPLGHTWVFGGGYVDTLGGVLVAASQPYGWRSAAEVRDAMTLQRNRYRAIAERSLVIGYEAAVAAVEIGAAGGGSGDGEGEG